MGLDHKARVFVHHTPDRNTQTIRSHEKDNSAVISSTLRENIYIRVMSRLVLFIRNRVDSVGGIIDIVSRAGRGTEINI